MRKMTRIGCLALAILICLGVPGALSEIGEAMLVADMSAGRLQAEEHGFIKRQQMDYEGDLDVFKLAQGLSDWSGLDFTIDQVTPTADQGLIIDWSERSTLVRGLDDRVQKEEFHFFDVESLSWFMMDSLLQTIVENLNVSQVYYTMEGGEDLFVDGMSFWESFPAEEPYKASQFYFENGDVPGGDELLAEDNEAQ